MQNLLYVIAAFVLVALNGFFVAAEFSLVKLRHTQATALAEMHGWRGRVLLNVHSHLDVYLSACQLGITLASLGLGWIGEPAFARLLDPLFSAFAIDPETAHLVAFIVAFTLISFLHIVLGELAPKSLALRRPEQLSLWTSVPLFVFYWLMYPAIWLLNASANLTLRIFGLQHADEHSQSFSREELKLILHSKRGARDSGEEITMMSHALELPELVVGDLLRTRDQLACLHEGMTQEEILAEFQRSQYSRYPWFDAQEENVLGVLHAKDLLQAVAGGRRIGDVRPMLRPAIVTSLDTRVLEVLHQFKGGHSSMALGREDSGRIAGFLTMNDVIQVIIGDVQDDSRRSGNVGVQRGPDGSLTITGGTTIYRLERLLDREIAAPDDINSVGGLIAWRLERLPQEGDSLTFPEGFTLIVRRMEGPRATAISVLSRGPD